MKYENCFFCFPLWLPKLVEKGIKCQKSDSYYQILGLHKFNCLPQVYLRYVSSFNHVFHMSIHITHQAEEATLIPSF